MGMVLDVVPNHMGVLHGDNPWWQDVLEKGRASRYAKFFDIDWLRGRGRLLLPVLAAAQRCPREGDSNDISRCLARPLVGVNFAGFR